jgi:hypothetical protein
MEFFILSQMHYTRVLNFGYCITGSGFIIWEQLLINFTDAVQMVNFDLFTLLRADDFLIGNIRATSLAHGEQEFDGHGDQARDGQCEGECQNDALVGLSGCNPVTSNS